MQIEISMYFPKMISFSKNVLVLDVTDVFWQKICQLQYCPFSKHATAVTKTISAGYQTLD
jgi:hypothetical protein